MTLTCRFILQEDIDLEICSNDPWLVLHKIDSPTKMRFMGNRVAQCNASDLDPSVVAPSIAQFVGGKGDHAWKQPLQRCHTANSLEQ